MSRTKAWGDYWRKAGITTFGDKPTYQGAIRDLWTDLAAELQDGAVIVDLGAGNGGLEEVFQKYSGRNDKAFTLHAVDAAHLIPKVTSAPDATCKIVWHEQTKNEQTGLDAASVDAAISIFGFEYGDLGGTVAELDRILKPRARCRFLMHHSESVLILDTAGEIAVLEDALAKGGMFDTTHDFLKEYGNIHKASQHRKMLESPAGERMLRTMTAARDRAAEKATTPNAGTLLQALSQGIAKLISPPLLFKSKESLLESLANARKAYQANLERLHDMQEASVGKQRLAAIAETFEKAGFSVETKAFFVEGFDDPVGWLVDAKR